MGDTPWVRGCKPCMLGLWCLGQNDPLFSGYDGACSYPSDSSQTGQAKH